MCTFSIIVATRNRPTQFAGALQSILEQTCASIEIIVVDDGSDEGHAAEYSKIIKSANRLISFRSLPRRPKGHGPSYVRNIAAGLAQGDYLCFLDDDDFWTDNLYLSRVRSTIKHAGTELDLHISNQSAFRSGRKIAEPIWLEDLAKGLARSAREPDAQGAYQISVDEVLHSERFCHLNTLIIRRGLFDDLGGFDEAIRWEEDRDLFWRAAERARQIYYSPFVVSRHNAPDIELNLSASTALSEIERRLYQAHVFDKAALFSAQPTIRKYGRLHKGYTLKRIAENCAMRRDYSAARFFARQALGAAPTLKWAIYTVLLGIVGRRN